MSVVNQTIEKIINFYRGVNQPMNDKINDWLQHDEESLNLFLTLCLMLSNNGWTLHEPFANYEDFATEEFADELYERAMSYFKGA